MAEIAVDPKRTDLKAIPYVFPMDDKRSHFAPGSMQKLSNGVVLACPGCGRVSWMSVAHPKPPQSPSWDVVGGSLDDVTTLTLQPSINCVGCCGWHGYLTNGVFKSC